MTCIIKVETIVDTLFRKLVKKIRAVKYNMKNIPGLIETSQRTTFIIYFIQMENFTFLIANGKEKNNFLHKKINNMHYDNKDAIMMVTIAVDFISSVGHCVYSNICIVHFEYLDHKPAGMI